MGQAIDPDMAWSALADTDGNRQRAMEDRFAQLALLGESERLDAIEGMLRAEFSLSESDLNEFTQDRLQAWIALAKRDPAQASAAARGYDAVIERLPAEMAMRRASVVQALARTMGPEDIATLHELIPSLRQSVPVAKAGLSEERARIDAARDRTAAVKKPFWKVWA